MACYARSAVAHHSCSNWRTEVSAQRQCDTFQCTNKSPTINNSNKTKRVNRLRGVATSNGESCTNTSQRDSIETKSKKGHRIAL